jgi:fatty acid desaturase
MRAIPASVDPKAAALAPPVACNVTLALLVPSVAVALLWAASRAPAGWVTFACALAFSYVMLTDYALLHEATHDNLHPDPRWNRRLGFVLGALFPVPFSMIRVTHRGHHERNRTDAEMFDLYYAHDDRFLKCVQWYGILLGFFWPFVPLGALLASLCPPVLRTRVFRERADTRPLLRDLGGPRLGRIRAETAAIVLVLGLLFLGLSLSPGAVLLCYACFAVNWSTRQYVGHAFSRRDVVHGAWNLRHNRGMSWLLLHGEWDLNHHRHPEVPWIHLPRLGSAAEERRDYVCQYWRQWLGPCPTSEPAPSAPEALVSPR